MAVEAKKFSGLSVQEYLAIEQSSGQKHEYHDGHIFAMAGGTIPHGLIAGNIFGELKFGYRQIGSRDCHALNSEIKLHIPSLNKFLYPDAMVVCGGFITSDREPNAITNPKIIIEVLSKSTESYDRGDKFYFYRQIPSLELYILIDQFEPKVEVYSRNQHMWEIDRITGVSNALTNKKLDFEIGLSAIYEGVTFE